MCNIVRIEGRDFTRWTARWRTKCCWRVCDPYSATDTSLRKWFFLLIFPIDFACNWWYFPPLFPYFGQLAERIRHHQARNPCSGHYKCGKMRRFYCFEASKVNLWPDFWTKAATRKCAMYFQTLFTLDMTISPLCDSDFVIHNPVNLTQEVQMFETAFNKVQDQVVMHRELLLAPWWRQQMMTRTFRSRTRLFEDKNVQGREMLRMALSVALRSACINTRGAEERMYKYSRRWGAHLYL